MQEPPIFLILCSAYLLKNLAFTITGMLGNCPFPNNLKYPNLFKSITTFYYLFYFAFLNVYALTNDHNFSILTVGQKYWLFFR